MADKYGNWLGVLKWSLAQNDGTRPSSFQPMSEENKKWLAKVFKSMTVDEAGRMRDIADVLALLPGNKPSVLSRAAVKAAQAAAEAAARGETAVSTTKPAPAPDTESDDDDDEDKAKALWEDPSQPLERRKLSALEDLEDLVGSSDNAKNLFAVGAFPSLMQAVTGQQPPEWNPAAEAIAAVAASAGAGAASAITTAAAEGDREEEEFASLAVQARAAEVLSTVLQNNPAAQTWSLQSGCLHGLVTALTHATIATDYLLSDIEISGISVEAREALLGRYLHLQTALVGALSSLTRHNGQAQAALVAGTDLNLATSSASSSGGGAAMMTMPAFEVDIETNAEAGKKEKAGSRVPLHEAAAALRGNTASIHTVTVRPFELVAHPISLWPLFASSTTSSPAKSKGRRLVRKALFFLQHLSQGAVNPDAIKAALLNCNSSNSSSNSSAFTGAKLPSGSWLGRQSAASSASDESKGIVSWLLRVLDDSEDNEASSLCTDGDSVHSRESALTILLSLSQKSDKGVDVKDETERR